MTITKTKCEVCDNQHDSSDCAGWISFAVCEGGMRVDLGEDVLRSHPSLRGIRATTDSLDFCSKACLLKFLKL